MGLPVAAGKMGVGRIQVQLAASDSDSGSGSGSGSGTPSYGVLGLITTAGSAGGDSCGFLRPHLPSPGWHTHHRDRVPPTSRGDQQARTC